MPPNLYEEWDLPKGRFVVTKRLSEGATLFRHKATDLDEVMPKREFERLHALGLAARVRQRDGRAGRYDAQDDVPPEGATDEEKARRFYCLKWDEAPCAKSDVALKRLVSYHAAEATRRGLVWRPSPGALRRAINGRGEMGNRPLRVMQSLRGKTSRQRWPLAVAEAMRRATLWYYAHLPRTKGDAHGYLVKFIRKLNAFGAHAHGTTWRKLPTPSDETLRTRIEAARNLTNLTAKLGEVEARRQMKGTVQAIRAEAILDYVLIDSTVVDGWCVIDDYDGHPIPAGRPTLTLAIDLYSRAVLAVVITYEPPSLYTIMSAVQRVTTQQVRLLDEDPELYGFWEELWGKPENILVDNEWAQVGVSFQDSCQDAGISVEWAPVKNPEYKSFVERIFGTLNKKLFHRLPGGVPFPPHLMRKLGLDPAKDAVIAREELERLVHQTLRDSYHYEVHSGTGFMPAARWKAGVEKGGREYVDDAKFLAQTFGEVGEATLTRSGIRFKGMRFHDSETTTQLLNDLAGTTPVRQRPKGSATVKVKIKFNPADASQIQVWNPRMKPRKRYVELPNVDEAYVRGGLGFWHHRVIKAFAKAEGLEFKTAEERVAARDRLRIAIENASPDMKMRAMRNYRRLKDPAKPVLQGNVVDFRQARPGILAIDDRSIPVVIAAEDRADGGSPGKGPRRGGRKAQDKAKKTRSRNTSPRPAAVSLPAPGATPTAKAPAVTDTANYYEDFKRRMAAANRNDGDQEQ